MRKLIILPLLASIFLLSGCLNSDDPKPFYVGFVTVDHGILGSSLELKSDKNPETEVYYTYNVINNADPKGELKDGDRSYVSLVIEKDYGNGYYDVTAQTLTKDLRKNFKFNPAAPEGLVEAYGVISEGLVTKNIYNQQILNISVRYVTQVDNKDEFVLAMYDEDQNSEKPSEIVLRLKHYQVTKTENTSSSYYDLLCYNLSELPPSLVGTGDYTLIIKHVDSDYTEREFKVEVKSQFTGVLPS